MPQISNIAIILDFGVSKTSKEEKKQCPHVFCTSVSYSKSKSLLSLKFRFLEKNDSRKKNKTGATLTQVEMFSSYFKSPG